MRRQDRARLLSRSSRSIATLGEFPSILCFGPTVLYWHEARLGSDTSSILETNHSNYVYVPYVFSRSNFLSRYGWNLAASKAK
jgi:hypothetical protein